MIARREVQFRRREASAMEDVTRWISNKLATKSSRRVAIAFVGQAALAAGLATVQSSVARASCHVDCPGGPCPCISPAPRCSTCGFGGCPPGSTTQDSWACCINGCDWICAECCYNGQACHCFVPTGVSCGSPFCGSRPINTPAGRSMDAEMMAAWSEDNNRVA
jgi:hypothetical protein